MTAVRWSSVLLVACFGSTALAQDDWVGKRVMLKRPGIKIGYSDDSGKQVYVAELTALSYPVLKESSGFLKVAHRGYAGWFPKTDALLPEEAVVYFAERSRLAKDTDSLPHAYLGWAHRERGQFDLALAAYDTAIKRDPRPDWFNNRGLVHMDNKNYEKAIADFTEAIKRSPKFTMAFENRATAYTKSNQPKLALDDWNEVIRQEPTNGPALLRRAKHYLDQKDLDKAVADLSRILKNEPQNVDVLTERGQLYVDQKKLDLALADFTEALRVEKDNVELLIARSQVYGDKKNYQAALADADAAVTAVPSSVEAVVARGWNRFLLGQNEKAAADFAKAVELNPMHPAPYNSQAWMWATCSDDAFRDGKKAVESAKKAVELTEGKEPTIHDTLAAAYAEAGDFDQAVKTQERVIGELTPGSELLADAQARLEKYKAKQPHRQAVAK